MKITKSREKNGDVILKGKYHFARIHKIFCNKFCHCGGHFYEIIADDNCHLIDVEGKREYGMGGFTYAIEYATSIAKMPKKWNQRYMRGIKK